MVAMSNKQQALWEQGQRYSQRERWSQAIAAYEAIVDHDRTFLPAWLELSLAYERLDRYRDAFEATIRAAAIDQVPPMAGLAVARRLRRFEDQARLRAYVDRTGLAGRLPPDRLLDLATFFSVSGSYEKALGWVEHVLKIRPDLADAHNMHGYLLMFLGRQEVAADAFERALRIRPQFASVYTTLSKVARITSENNHVDAIKRQLLRPGLTLNDEYSLCYALHNELHDLADYTGAWEALARGCRARRADKPYDHAKTLALFDQLRRIFDAAFCRGEETGDPLVPIFIVGMHRSGTTLIERILSGHPDVADAGETYTFSAQTRHAADHFCNVVTDGVIVSRAQGFDYRAIGRGFLDAIRTRGEVRGFVTEKQNPNFTLLGPIAKALPHAKLVHMKRDPVDTCFSNMRTIFTREADYSHDQVEVADFYKAYSDLMAHWHEAMPGRILDVEYEALVAEPEAQARRIADYCGLAFRSEMLQVERSTGAVATASSNLVRKGIVRNRGGAWRTYEAHLGPLVDRLGAHGLV